MSADPVDTQGFESWAKAVLAKKWGEGDRDWWQHAALKLATKVDVAALSAITVELARLRRGDWTDEERKLFLFEATKASYAEGVRAGCEDVSIAAAEMSAELDQVRALIEKWRGRARIIRENMDTIDPDWRTWDVGIAAVCNQVEACAVELETALAAQSEEE